VISSISLCVLDIWVDDAMADVADAAYATQRYETAMLAGSVSLADCTCTRRLWVSDGFNTTDFLCTAGNNEVIFTSSSNQATVFFTVASHKATPARGFWLLYEGTYEWKCIDLKCVRKPTRSWFSLTHHANKSSRWAE